MPYSGTRVGDPDAIEARIFLRAIDLQFAVRSGPLLTIGDGNAVTGYGRLGAIRNGIVIDFSLGEPWDVSTIARESGIDQGHLSRIQIELEERGLIKREIRGTRAIAIPLVQDWPQLRRMVQLQCSGCRLVEAMQKA